MALVAATCPKHAGQARWPGYRECNTDCPWRVVGYQLERELRDEVRSRAEALLPLALLVLVHGAEAVDAAIAEKGG